MDDAADGQDRGDVMFAMTLSLVIGIAMLAIKMGAYLLTNSAAILSDAAESVVHVAAVSFAFYSLRLSYKPADSGHLYGHAKVSFFSAGFEGATILLAALYIFFEAIRRFVSGGDVQHVGVGLTLTLLAVVINGLLGGYLVWTGKRRRSIILLANGKHVLTDCWTSLGVVVGLFLVWATGYMPLDPIAAMVVAGNIGLSGISLIRQSVGGLMDTADPNVHQQIESLVEAKTRQYGVAYHNLRHRNLGDLLWVEVHLLFPNTMTISEAHQIATQIEESVAADLPSRAYVTTHLEALEDHDQVHSSEMH